MKKAREAQPWYNCACMSSLYFLAEKYLFTSSVLKLCVLNMYTQREFWSFV